MNSCVRSQLASSKRSSILCTDTGRSKIIRICCSPPCEARQPGPSSGPNADSIGKLGSSDVTSTVAICSRSSQPLSDWPPCWAWCGPTILFRIISFSSQNDAFRFILRYQSQATAKRGFRKPNGRANECIEKPGTPAVRHLGSRVAEPLPDGMWAFNKPAPASRPLAVLLGLPRAKPKNL